MLGWKREESLAARHRSPSTASDASCKCKRDASRAARGTSHVQGFHVIILSSPYCFVETMLVVPTITHRRQPHSIQLIVIHHAKYNWLLGVIRSPNQLVERPHNDITDANISIFQINFVFRIKLIISSLTRSYYLFSRTPSFQEHLQSSCLFSFSDSVIPFQCSDMSSQPFRNRHAHEHMRVWVAFVSKSEEHKQLSMQY